MIFCEFNYCIYNKRSKCIFKIISISPLGMCEDCLIPNIADETLDKYKKEVLERLEPKMINKKEKKKNNDKII